ncbi:TPA: hypothetical protein SLZ51_003540, partial [Vibrio cholerae]|uniref:hypothetical protein n=1 Tax=Vibrio TaxID=662 RepID=UPI001C9010D1|nr:MULTISPECIES: hypothetical protein [Vibrio]EJL6474633.1 hypothetical protein [Vibrio cholerae]EKF9277617.1 hypothetical protein [Vibrio cholerae]MBY3673817.1 hypothetical protein [Vibrio cholerae]WKY95230.1 hypothetical protein QYQ96_14865 [Vibrio metoecus]HEJ2459119.1 hypothetical protein [Vibrio cholerae]
MKKNNYILPTLWETITNKQYVIPVSEYLELAFDSLLDNEIIKTVPIVNLMLFGNNLTSSIKNQLLLKKILLFINSQSDLSTEKRDDFLLQLESNPKEKIRIGEKLILVLDQADDMSKPELIGELFKAFVAQEFDFEIFSRLVDGVNRVPISALSDFLQHDFYSVSAENTVALAFGGFMSFSVPIFVGSDEALISYKPNSLGDLLKKYCGKKFT